MLPLQIFQEHIYPHTIPLRIKDFREWDSRRAGIKVLTREKTGKYNWEHYKMPTQPIQPFSFYSRITLNTERCPLNATRTTHHEPRITHPAAITPTIHYQLN